MSDQESIDIAKVVNLIIENPGLIQQISGLVKQNKPTTEAVENTLPEPQKEQVTMDNTAEPTVARPTYASLNQRSNRAQLLGALKPYVSEERAKAIDSMISIADVLDIMKTR